MPKLKSHKGLLKRVKITGKGKVKHKRAGMSHLMSGTPGKDKRKMNRDLTVSKPVAKMMERMLHIRLIGRDQG